MQFELSEDAQQEMDYIQSQIRYNKKPRLLFLLPESAGDILLSTSLLPALRETYFDFDIYYACKSKFFDILKENPNIDYLIESREIMKDVPFMEGSGSWPGFFDVCLHVGLLTQNYSHYVHNSMDRIKLKLK